MKVNEIRLYKNFGTITRVTDDEGDVYYETKHLVTGSECSASSIREAEKVLRDAEVTAQEIQAAITKLTIYGYKVYKEVS